MNNRAGVFELTDRLNSRFRPYQPLFDRLLAMAWPSYLLIAALQAKILWNIWKYRDVTTGDTASYFSFAFRWSDSLHVDLLFSPLYTAFIGTLYDLTGNVYTTVISHRIIIVMAASLLMLALMRRLLPASIALLIAAWWTVLPINFDVLYEVHLFALVTVLVAWLAASRDTPLARGSALAILLASTVLVRNELVIGFLAFALICLVRELQQLRLAGYSKSFWQARVVDYSVPLFASIALCVGFYFRSTIKLPALLTVLHHKHAFNMCQLFAFGYRQQHPEWDRNPWLACPELMTTLFGNPEPTLWQMMAVNPGALFDYFLWNVSLILGGVQLALFNAVSGAGNPDFYPIYHNPLVLVPTLVVAAIVAAGAIKMIKHWDYWWQNWICERRGLWLAMLAVLCVAGPVILTQRPRPSYLFPATVVMMATIGTLLYVLIADRRMAIANTLAVIGVPLLVLAIPPYFSWHKSDRPSITNYNRLLPFAELLSDRRNRLIIGDNESYLVDYLKLRDVGIGIQNYSLLATAEAKQNLLKVLDAERVNVIFVQPQVMPELKAQPAMRQLMENPEAAGWKKLAPLDGDTSWILLYRDPQT